MRIFNTLAKDRELVGSMERLQMVASHDHISDSKRAEAKQERPRIERIVGVR